MTGCATVIRADARSLPLPDASVDLIVTSPPYFALRSYIDGGEHYDGQIGSESTPAEYVAALVDCTREWVRVLKPTGSVWVNLGDSYLSGKGAPGRTTVDKKSAARTVRRAGGNPLDGPSFGIGRKSLIGLPWRYALACIDELGLILRAEVIWSKPNGLPESVTDRVRRSHETWFHLTRSPRYFAAVDEIREAYTAAWKASGSNALAGQQTIRKRGRSDPDERNPLGKLPGSVWEIATEPLTVPDHLGVDHFAAFPTEWPRRIILGWSPVGGVVADPFGGTGTTALVAKALGRIGISVDRSADYCRLAQWRTTDPRQLAGAMRVDKPEPVPDAQIALDFEGVAV